MKVLSLRNILLAATAVILIGAISTVLWLRNMPATAQPLENVSAQPEAAMLVPRNAPLMVSTLVNVERLKQAGLSTMGVRQRRHVQDDIHQLEQQIKATLGLDYDADIAPWAGDEMTFALTSWDVDRNPETGVTPGYLLVVSIGDAEQADGALQQLWQRQSPRTGEYSTEDYSGVAIQFIESEADDQRASARRPPIATAQIGQHYSLFSNSANVLRNAVNTLQASQLSLGHSPDYIRALEQLPNKRIALVWANIPEIQTWWAWHGSNISTAVDAAPLDAPPSTEQAVEPGLAVSNISSSSESLIADASLSFSDENLDDTHIPASQRIEMVATSVAIAPGGLVADTVLTPTLGHHFAAHTSQPLTSVSPLNFIPSDSSFMLTGHALRAVKDGLVQFANQGNPLAQQIVTLLAERQAEWPFDEATQAIDWAVGDYAIARVPIDQPSPDASVEERVDWLFVVPKSESAQAAVSALDANARAQGLNVDTLTIQKDTTTVWTQLSAMLHPDRPSNPVSLDTKVVGIHAEPDTHEVFATSVNAMGKALLFGDRNLSVNAEFQSAIATLDANNDGYFYIDWDLAEKTLIEAFPEITPFIKGAKPLLSPLRSLVMTRYDSQPNVQRLGTMLQYATKAK
jgi:hypothetical protein